MELLEKWNSLLCDVVSSIIGIYKFLIGKANENSSKMLTPLPTPLPIPWISCSPPKVRSYDGFHVGQNIKCGIIVSCHCYQGNVAQIATMSTLNLVRSVNIFPLPYTLLRWWGHPFECRHKYRHEYRVQNGVNELHFQDSTLTRWGVGHYYWEQAPSRGLLDGGLTILWLSNATQVSGELSYVD